MKIGIITHWNVPNYGSFLQAYALRNVIESLLPDSQVELISYIKPIHIKVYYSFEVHELYRWWIINPSFYADVMRRIGQKNVISKRRSFKNYYDKNIPHSKKMKSKDIYKQDYDFVVLGSDILWDYSVNYFGKDPVLFGINTTKNKKISYAASFGTVKRNANHPEYVEKGLKQLSATSVRDANSSLIVNDITGEKPKVVLDPTLLWDFTNDKCVSSPEIKEDYMVVYGTEFSKEQIEAAITFARNHGLRIVSIDGDKGNIPWADDEIEIPDLSPMQWVGYIKNASLVMTCTFHGLMFSLIYNKRLFFNATQFMRDKAESIITRYGLNDVLLQNKSFNQQIAFDWETAYERINEQIEIDRMDSMDYLKKSLCIDQ